jgi:prepilin-type N-terminal cleavage/methylation domain-containing protein
VIDDENGIMQSTQRTSPDDSRMGAFIIAPHVVPHVGSALADVVFANAGSRQCGTGFQPVRVAQNVEESEFEASFTSPARVENPCHVDAVAAQRCHHPVGWNAGCAAGHPSRRARRRAGFTLIEVLATLLLMSIVLPVIMRGMSLATAAASTAKRRTEASTLADSKINELVATGQWQNGSTSGDFGTDWPDYTWTADAVDYDGTNQELDVTVNWTGRNGQPDALTVTTLVYSNNPIAAANSTTGSSSSGTSGSSMGGAK